MKTLLIISCFSLFNLAFAQNLLNQGGTELNIQSPKSAKLQSAEGKQAVIESKLTINVSDKGDGNYR